MTRHEVSKTWSSSTEHWLMNVMRCWKSGPWSLSHITKRHKHRAWGMQQTRKQIKEDMTAPENKKRDVVAKTVGTKSSLMVFVAWSGEEVCMDHLMQQSFLQLCCSAGLENRFWQHDLTSTSSTEFAHTRSSESPSLPRPTTLPTLRINFYKCFLKKYDGFLD